VCRWAAQVAGIAVKKINARGSRADSARAVFFLRNHRVSVHRSPADTLANGRAARAQHHTVRCRRVQLAAVPESRGYGRGCSRGARVHSPLCFRASQVRSQLLRRSSTARARVSEWVGHGNPLYPQKVATQGQRIRDSRIRSALCSRSASTTALCCRGVRLHAATQPRRADTLMGVCIRDRWIYTRIVPEYRGDTFERIRVPRKRVDPYCIGVFYMKISTVYY
jgi:hypothetical protein